MRSRINCSFLLSGWYPFAAIALAVLLIYGKTTGFDFLDYDEASLIVNNQSFLVNFRSIYSVFSQGIHDHFSHFYRPLLMISFMIDAHVSGLNSFGYHVSNILFHISASWLVYVLFDRLDTGRIRSFVLALIFAVHPILAASVAWIPGRNDSLLGIAVFAGFIFLNEYLKQHRIRDFCLHILFVLIALLIKETALAFIPVCMMFLLLMKEKAGRREWNPLLIAWAMTGILFVSLDLHAISYGNLPFDSLSGYVASMPRIVMAYIGKMVIPVNLSVCPYISDLPFVSGVCVTIGILLLLCVSRDKRMNRIWFGILWAVMFYLPPIIINRDGFFFEHRSYVPLVGILLVLSEVRGPFCNRVIAWYRYAAGLLIIGILAVFSLIDVHYSETFKDSASFWENASRTSPHSFLVNCNAAASFFHAGKYDQALKYYQMAARIQPDNPEARRKKDETIALMESGNTKDSKPDLTQL